MKKKQNPHDIVAEAPRRRGRPPRATEAPEELAEKQGLQADDGFGSDDLLSLTELPSAHDPDPREIDNLTDRIFGSVLSRYGWQFEDGHIEHVGDQTQRQGR
jgi:hypothetical protein